MTLSQTFRRWLDQHRKPPVRLVIYTLEERTIVAANLENKLRELSEYKNSLMVDEVIVSLMEDSCERMAEAIAEFDLAHPSQE